MIRRVHYSPDLFEEWCAEGALSEIPTKHVWIKDRIRFSYSSKLQVERTHVQGSAFLYDPCDGITVVDL